MALESLTGASVFIDDLVNTNPVGATDPKSEGDDHIRGIKNVLLNSFPGVTGAVSATHTELNLLDGVTSTTAELNLLDGVTATTAELNQLDESARAVAGYVSGAVTYTLSDTSTLSGTGLDMDAGLTESTWETIGPTDSGATNIWTALDVIPLTASAVILQAYSYGAEGGSPSMRTMRLGLADSGQTGSATNEYLMVIDEKHLTGAGGAFSSVAIQNVPLDASNIFTGFWANDCPTGQSAILYLHGWIE